MSISVARPQFIVALGSVAPADRPVQYATKLELVIARKTAKAPGLTIGQSFLRLADQVIA